MGIFTVTPPSYAFRVGDDAKLSDTLLDIDLRSTLSPVRCEADVLLDQDGRTQAGGYQLTDWAFYQLCQAACSGLYKLVTDYAGCERKEESARSSYSPEEAIDILNRVIRRRFREKLAGRQMMRDTQTGIVDGIVGATYRWFPNRALYEQTLGTFQQLSPVPRLYEAKLEGRRLLVRFFQTKTYCELETPDGNRDRLVRAYHISNDEVGRAAVRVGSLLLRETGLTASFLPVAAGRVRHQGSAIQARVRKLFSRLPERLLGSPELARGSLENLRATPLGFTGDIDRDTKRRTTLVHLLARRKLTKGEALRVLSDAVCQGSYDEHPNSSRLLSHNDIVGRSVYDLYNAIGRFARSRAVAARERVEQVAFGLVSGRFTIPRLEEG